MAELEHEPNITVQAVAHLVKYINPGTIPHQELSRGFVSNRAILIPYALRAVEDLIREVERLKEYEWMYKDLCD